MNRLKDRLADLWASARVRIIVWAALTGLFFGLSPVGMPIEDFYYNLRIPAHQRSASGTIGIIEIDDRTLSELGLSDVSRELDAKLIDNLFDAGAKRIFFDRVFKFAGNPEGDAAFARALERHRGKIFLGAAPDKRSSRYDRVGEFPNSEFRSRAGLVALSVEAMPFGLSFDMPFAAKADDWLVPSMSAELANHDTVTTEMFTPDFNIDHETIPSFSYVDVITGKVSADEIRGRDFVIAPAAAVFNDEHLLAGRVMVTGAVFHVIAAETLLRGKPLNLGFLPALGLVLVVAASGMRRRTSLDRYRICGLVLVLGILPFVLDRFAIQFAIVPAVAAAIVTIFKMRTLDKVEEAGETNATSGLPGVQLLRNRSDKPGAALVAIKIRNYGAIVGSFDRPIEAKLANEILRRIRITEKDVPVYHEGGMFLWLSGIVDPVLLGENLEGLHSIVQRGVNIDGWDIDLSFNCGIDFGMDDPLAVRAANAMQSAEEAARQDEFICIHEGGSDDAQWEISLLSALDRAIDNGEVWVAYQPKFDIKTGAITGAEALARWTHPERGPINPDKFISIAEAHHRIDRLTRFVLDKAAYTAAQLALTGRSVSISVNISAQLLRNPGLPGMIESALVKHKLDPANLILEITETDRLDRSSKTIAMLEKLVDAGLKLSIDDFGTGNATIDYLRYLPAEEVKIDRLFISNMDSDRSDYVLVQSIIDMAHSLGRKVVAEGVETQDVFHKLEEMGCDMIQGYLVSKPVPYKNLFRLIARDSHRLIG